MRMLTKASTVITQDNRSLLDIYNELPSPAPERLIDDLSGLRSTLYAYQRRTVSTMMARENHVGSIEDPLYLPLHGMDGRTFYLQPATFEIVTERPRVSSVPGGILCEELGGYMRVRSACSGADYTRTHRDRQDRDDAVAHPGDARRPLGAGGGVPRGTRAHDAARPPALPDRSRHRRAR